VIASGFGVMMDRVGACGFGQVIASAVRIGFGVMMDRVGACGFGQVIASDVRIGFRVMSVFVMIEFGSDV